MPFWHTHCDEKFQQSRTRHREKAGRRTRFLFSKLYWVSIIYIITWAYPKGSPSLKLPKIAVWALKRMRPCLLSLRMRTYARQHMVKNGGFISSVILWRKHEYLLLWLLLYSQTTYKCTHRLLGGGGRPTLNVFERFLKGWLRRLHERSIYERTFLSEPIENHAKCISNELSNVNHAKNKLHRHYRLFRCVCEPSRIPIRTLKRLRNKNRKIREFVYKTRCVVNGWKRHCGRTLICWEQFRDIRCWQSRCSKRGSRISGIRNQMNIGK